MELPIEQLWFNILLWAVISAYSANGLGNFIAYIPGSPKKDAEILGYNCNTNYSFQLTSSLIFCLIGISLFKYPLLVYLTIVEAIFLIVFYLYLVESKIEYLKSRKAMFKKISKSKKKIDD